MGCGHDHVGGEGLALGEGHDRTPKALVPPFDSPGGRRASGGPAGRANARRHRGPCSATRWSVDVKIQAFEESWLLASSKVARNQNWWFPMEVPPLKVRKGEIESSLTPGDFKRVARQGGL